MSEFLRSSQEEEVKAESPLERFRVNPEDYPIFRWQAQKDPTDARGRDITWNIDRTLSKYVTSTASLIAMMDGTAETYEENEELEKPDHVIYLDKSARPASWMVNIFWDDFSKEKRPEHSYLNIDRLPWFRRVGLELDAGNYARHEDGSSYKPGPGDFLREADRIPDEVFARIRALYVPGGVETEDLTEIMKMPTSLDGKNLMIVDEVADTGATLEIAKYLLKRAIPAIKSIQGDYFWDSGVRIDADGGQQQLSVPVWYSHSTSEGRGIGDVNEPFFMERYRQNPTPRTRAQALGALVLSEYVDLGQEKSQASRELAKEMLKMHEDYEAGKIMLQIPQSWGIQERAAEAVEEQGMLLGRNTMNDPRNYLNVLKAIEGRSA